MLQRVCWKIACGASTFNLAPLGGEVHQPIVEGWVVQHFLIACKLHCSFGGETFEAIMFGRYMNRAGRFVRTNVDARRTRFNFSNPLARENIPFYGAIIGITAFTFQITVLHPWHDQLSEQFIDIEVGIVSLI